MLCCTDSLEVLFWCRDLEREKRSLARAIEALQLTSDSQKSQLEQNQRLKTAALNEASDLRKQLDSAQNELTDDRATHADTLTRLNADHRQELSRLASTHAAALKSAEQKFAAERDELEHRCNELEGQIRYRDEMTASPQKPAKSAGSGSGSDRAGAGTGTTGMSVRELELELASAKQQNRELTQSVSNLKANLARLSATNGSWQSDLQSTIANLERTNASTDEALKTLSATNRELQQRLNDADRAIDSHQKQIKEMSAIQLKSQNTVQQLKSDHAASQYVVVSVCKIQTV